LIDTIRDKSMLPPVNDTYAGMGKKEIFELSVPDTPWIKRYHPPEPVGKQDRMNQSIDSHRKKGLLR
jgi:hypothetical protein